jgi:hypothetical protein
MLRATGNVTVSGTVVVLPGTEDSGSGTAEPHPGVARAPAGSHGGGIGLTVLQASQLTRPTVGGGAGGRSHIAQGGEGGGSLVIAARGSVSVPAGGSISANGNNGVNPNTAGLGITGPGGGAGGVILIASGTSISIAGSLRANGGNGANGFDGNGGTFAEGGGGGGGGGIIHLIAPSTPTVSGPLQVSAGSAGANNGTGTTVNTGGGGGACGGNGGNGGGTLSGVTLTPSNGQSGHTLTTRAPLPETLLL